MRRILADHSVYFLFAALLLAVIFFTAHSITVNAYNNGEKSDYALINGSVSYDNICGKTIDAYQEFGTAFFDLSIDEAGLVIILLCIQNLLTLFNKLIVILSLQQFYLYLTGWIIMVSQVINNNFLLHYLQLKDGKKCSISNRFSFSY